MKRLRATEEYILNKRVILFIHGIAGNPNQFNILTGSVPEGTEKSIILLKGHGGSVDDFSRASMKDWQAQVDEAIDSLKKEFEEIYVAAHSMGTLFALQRADRPEIKGLFLLAVPLKVRFKLLPFFAKTKKMFVSALRGKGDNFEPCYGIEADFRVWKYIRWIPNYMSLLSEIKKTREMVRSRMKLNKKCIVFQSLKDEMVDPVSFEYLREIDTDVTMLETSAHYEYSAEDLAKIINGFKRWLE